jgi:excisionase family DNA binding protein
MRDTTRKNKAREKFDLSKPVFNMREAAAFLSLDVKTLRKRVDEGEVPARKIGRDWRFSREALEKMFSSPK